MLQVCSYRCIVSHESQLLEDFSLCILQKHNCLGKSAEIPALPDPPPMTAFRGEELTHELAESLFIGWLGIPSSATASTIQETAGRDESLCCPPEATCLGMIVKVNCILACLRTRVVLHKGMLC